MFRIYLFLIVLVCQCVAIPLTKCQQGVNCFLPRCFCPTFDHPMNLSDIPQMVYFGFDDAVNSQMANHYDFLFLKDNLTNPNGCPISITLLVSDEFTDYSILKRYYQHGFELGVHSVTHTHINTGDKVREEAGDQRDNFVTQVGISKYDVVGWRSPFLITAGDQQIDALKQLGFKYDVSLIYTRPHIDNDDVWPFTLDYGWPFKCHNNRCPKQNHKGFWQVPINPLIDYTHEFTCAFVDGCAYKPRNEAEAYKYIMDNFYRHYNGNRSPFGLHIHAAWFETKHLRDGMNRAIHSMNELEDVYIVNIKQMIEWMKYPTKLSEIKTFDGLGCWPRDKAFLHILLMVLPVSSLFILVIALLVYVIRKLMFRSRHNDYIALNGKKHMNKLVHGSDDVEM
ncbi:chitin deacetylase 8-like [Argopecten irradians]|uniref:chitin deacetylase 8-like n=1 Tax=Argopecten irradians TaxID=31199 RepID=UPI0037246DBF